MQQLGSTSLIKLETETETENLESKTKSFSLLFPFAGSSMRDEELCSRWSINRIEQVNITVTQPT